MTYAMQMKLIYYLASDKHSIYIYDSLHFRSNAAFISYDQKIQITVGLFTHVCVRASVCVWVCVELLLRVSLTVDGCIHPLVNVIRAQ